MLTLVLLIFSALYATFTLALWLTWLRLPTISTDKTLTHGPLISVIIPARDEAKNLPRLLDDLHMQTYRSFEVIVADDASTDNTLDLVQSYAKTSSYTLHSLPLSDDRVASPKKRAIKESIRLATGKLIVTTDGDCRVSPNWLAAFANCYQTYQPYMITGPVTFTSEFEYSIQSVFNSLQIVEFSSLIGSGASTLAWNRPTMCNGANLCYEKRVFEEVGGFTGVDHLASGDDELLMHKIASRYPGKVRFLKNSDAIVQTESHHSLRKFYNQRKRWASKWRAYQNWGPSILAVFIFLCNLTPVLAVIGWSMGYLSKEITWLIIGLKFIPELLFLGQVLHTLRKTYCILFIPLTQLLYPLYVIFFGLAAQGKGYEWKGRKLN